MPRKPPRYDGQGRLLKRCCCTTHQGERWLPAETEFWRNLGKNDGRQPWCKACITERRWGGDSKEGRRRAKLASILKRHGLLHEA